MVTTRTWNWARERLRGAGTLRPDMGRAVVDDNGFVRGAPLPSWAAPRPVPPDEAPGRRRGGVWMRLADTQLWAGDTPAYLINRAEQVDDPGALGHIGQVSLPYNPRHQRLLLHAVRILRGDEVIDHTHSAELRFLQREAGLEQGVVSGLVTATMVLPDVRVGDTLHLTYTVEGENPIFAGRYAGWAGWDQQHPVGHRHVSLVAPAGRDIRWQWVGDRPGDRPAPEVSLHDGLRTLRFVGEDLAAVPFEPYLPRDAHPLRWLQFTEYGSWAEVAAWAMTLFPDAPLPGSLEPLLRRLRALPTDEERVSQALQWVQSEIRYYSVSLGEGSHRPRLPEEVMARRYGDCKDKSLLLSRLLQQLGLDARPTLVAAQTRQAPVKLLPSPEAFDHVVVRVRLQDEDFFVDPTRHGQSGPLAWMGQGMEDAAVLVVAPDTTQLVTVRSRHRAQLFGNELHERFVVERLDGPVRLLSEQHWHGLGAESLRGMLVRMDASQLAHWALGRYERRHPGVQLEGAPEVQHDAERNRLTVRARYLLPKALARTEDGWTLRHAAWNLQGAFVLPETLRRVLPLSVPAFPGRLEHVAEVHWPDGVAVSEPPSTERLDGTHFDLRVHRSARGPVTRQGVVLQPLVAAVPADELPTLVEDLRRLDPVLHGQSAVPHQAVPPTQAGAPASLRQRQVHQLHLQAERARRAIARGHLHDEDLAQALALRSQALAELGNATEALAEAQRAVVHGPALPAAWAARGHAHWVLGRFAEADHDFGRALQLDGDAFALHLQRGQARFYAGELERAADDFERAAAQAPDAASRLQAQVWQGWAWRRLGRTLPPALQAAAAQPAPTGPAAALALQAGSMSTEELLREALRTPGDARELALMEAWFAVGQHHLVQGRPDQAREAFTRSEQAGVPRHPEPLAARFELQRLERR